MNSRQESKLNMFRATQKHCVENASIVASIPAFQAAVNSFNNNISSIIAAVQQEDLITKGITIDKAEARKKLCQLCADMAAPISAYAAANQNNKLLSEVNLSYTDLFKSKDDQLAPRCQNIHNAAQANLAALEDYGISQQTVDTLQIGIDNYQAKVPDPRNVSAQKSTISDNLIKLIDECDTILKTQMDKTIIALKTTQPDFVNTYKSNRVIIDPSKTTTTLKGIIMSAADKSVIKGATILIVEANTKVTTNDLGEYEIKPIPSGTYSLNVTAPKHKEKVLTDILVKKGQINKQVNMLEPA
jgi:hypothetical protein